MRVLRVSLIVSVLCLALTTLSVFAANPSSGTISATNLTFMWEGKAYVAQALPDAVGAGACPPQDADPLDAVCDHLALTVDVPPSYWDTHSGGARVTISWADAADDFDMYIYDKDGNFIDSSAGVANVESVFIDRANADDSPYDVRVMPFLVTDTGYTGTADFDAVEGIPPLPKASRDRGIRFSASTVVDPQRDLGEPSLRIDKKDNIYSCGPASSSRGQDYAQKCEDRGDTFRILGQPPEGRVSPNGGGDCEISVGTELNQQGEYTFSHTGLEALVNFSTARSLDAGRSFVGTATSESPIGVDRQWMESNGANEVWLGYNGIVEGYTIQRSTDGGLTYAPLGVPVSGTDSVHFVGPIRLDRNPAHNPLYNAATGENNEIIYATYTADAQPPAIPNNRIRLARSFDEGQTWEQFTVAEGPPDQFNPNALFPTLAIDTDGNLYTAWTEQGSFNLYYAYSPRLTDPSNPGAGSKWSSKRLVNRQGVNSTVMPWIEAGDPGRIVVTYYGSPSEGKLDDPNFKGYWHIYANVSFNALSAPDKKGNVDFSQIRATTHPVHWDQICIGGLSCVTGGDRTLLDFIQNRLDPRGGIHIVYTNSNKIPRAVEGRRSIDMYLKQIAGPGLYANQTPTPDSRAVKRGRSDDPLNDALFPFSAFGAPPQIRDNLSAMDITLLTLVNNTKPGMEPGTFDINLKLADISRAALNAALVDQTTRGSPASSLLFVVRWTSGTDPKSAVAKWVPGVGFTFGFDRSIKGATGGGLEIYPGNDITIPGCRVGDTLVMTIKPSDFQVVLPPSSPSDDPTVRTAAAGDLIYDVTAFTFGNASAVPETQSFLNQADSTAPFDFQLGAGETTGVSCP